jgi:2-polyprenyl-3-methyl-5-hydroxy-6-metoxy-1,4-benzoquinol methylase
LNKSLVWLCAVCCAQVGCGAGNSAFPLLALNPQLRVYACDFSPRAVELVKAHPEYVASGEGGRGG